MGPPVKRGTESRISSRKQAFKQRQAAKESADASISASLSRATQQRILDVFTQAFTTTDQDHDFKSILQEVKGHLFNRDFHAAFGKSQYLEVYAVRWSAARALAYADIFTRENRQTWFGSASMGLSPGSSSSQSIPEPSGQVSYPKSHLSNSPNPAEPTYTNEVDKAMNVACIGGGAGAEIVGLTTVFREASLKSQLNVYAIDVADWAAQMKQLYTALSNPPPISEHASQAIKDSNVAFIEPDKFSLTFLHTDILEPGSTAHKHVMSQHRSHEAEQDELLLGSDIEQFEDFSRLFASIDLVTMMFTLNELFTTSLPKTTNFLLHLTDTMRAGSHLLVVDSPGSYSEVNLGKNGVTKSYPMKWLLDHTLLEASGAGRWRKIEDEDSLWFRLDNRGKHLKYPVELENCRYQIHVYQKQ